MAIASTKQTKEKQTKLNLHYIMENISNKWQTVFTSIKDAKNVRHIS